MRATIDLSPRFLCVPEQFFRDVVTNLSVANIKH